ncbi:MAG: monovalent cation/H(+) antiporter subunit G [Hyphomicrobiaceae bacterium]
MSSLVIDLLSWPLIVAGSIFIVIGAVGMVRMPDVYTRMHAASVIDTLGAGLLILGLVLQAGLSLNALKLLILLALIFFFGPVVTHALAQASLHEGVEPLLSEDRRERRSSELAASGDSSELAASGDKGNR